MGLDWRTLSLGEYLEAMEAKAGEQEGASKTISEDEAVKLKRAMDARKRR